MEVDLEDTSCVDATTQTDSESESRPPSTVSEPVSVTEATSSQMPWYKEEKYSRYWKHHAKVSSWYHSTRACREAAQWLDYYKEMTNYHIVMANHMQHLSSYYSNWQATWTRLQHGGQPMPQRASHAARTPSPRKRKLSKSRAKSRQKMKRRREKVEKPVRVVPPHEQFEMDFTDEMKDFFVKSAEHKRERDARKKAVEANEEKEDIHVDIGTVKAGVHRATVLPPSERPGARRTEEMRALYGAGAAMIHGMETAMQLNYDRNCDRQQPKLWPHLPLKIKFS